MKKTFLSLSFILLSLPLSAQNIIVKANTFILDGVSNQIIADGNVSVTRKKMTISGSSVNYDQDTRTIQIKKALFDYPPYKGKSHEADYNIPAQIVTLTGESQIKDESDILKSESIVFNLKTNKLITRGKTKVTFSKSL
ncbi:hypothetical protein HOH87_05665 [bacterium]|jgi:lipopolysaccharide transport protein LptA|nr:hypothetical protein [bacterium]